MTERSNGPAKIDRRMAGVPIRLQARTLQPVARVTGWSNPWGSHGGAATLRTIPVEVLVTDEDGHIYRVPITVSKNDTVRWLALAGLLVLPLNWLLRRTLRRRRLS